MGSSSHSFWLNPSMRLDLGADVELVDAVVESRHESDGRKLLDERTVAGLGLQPPSLGPGVFVVPLGQKGVEHLAIGVARDRGQGELLQELLGLHWVKAASVLPAPAGVPPEEGFAGGGAVLDCHRRPLCRSPSMAPDKAV